MAAPAAFSGSAATTSVMAIARGQVDVELVRPGGVRFRAFGPIGGRARRSDATESGAMATHGAASFPPPRCRTAAGAGCLARRRPLHGRVCRAGRRRRRPRPPASGSQHPTSPSRTSTDAASASRRLPGQGRRARGFNPEVPLREPAHLKGSLEGTAARHMAEGSCVARDRLVRARQAGLHPRRDTRRHHLVRASYASDPAKRRDRRGGRAYGATNTPHLFVIDKAGTLVYAAERSTTRPTPRASHP